MFVSFVSAGGAVLGPPGALMGSIGAIIWGYTLGPHGLSRALPALKTSLSVGAGIGEV